MGLIKAIAGAVGGGLADQWLEVLEANDMGAQTLFARGVTVRSGDKRNSNKKGTADTVSNGSIIHVYDNQCMLLVDGGKIVDYTADILPIVGQLKLSTQRIPADNTYQYASIRGMSVLVPDLEANRKLLKEFLGNE